MIEVVGDHLVCRFAAPWTAEGYDLFLRTKRLPEHRLDYDEVADAYTVETPARFGPILGVEVPKVSGRPLPVPGFLFDYQQHFLDVALAAKRYAAWWDTGLGKTILELEWARQVQALTGGRVLLVFPLNLIPQALAMAAQFYSGLSILRLETRAEFRSWCDGGAAGLAVTNPEKFLPRLGESEVTPEVQHLAGVCLDESSLLKTGGGRIKWAMIKSCRGIEYKLSATATPAPNDPIEYASQAAWLERIRDEGEVIWTYFVREKDGEWRVKAHALPAFYRFLAGWSCYLRDPKRYGFADNLKGLPEPERIVHEIEATAEQVAAVRSVPDATGQASLLDPTSLGIVERGKFGQLAAGFAYDGHGGARLIPSRKPGLICDLVEQDLADGRPVLVWTLFDETALILAEDLAGRGVDHQVLTGKVPKAKRAAVVERFIGGELQVLVTRPRLLGWGWNLQICGSMVFADLDDSYEAVYQAERRAYRYGQTRSVRIHYPIVPELQGAVWSNLERKRRAFEGDVARMERLYIAALREQEAAA